VVLLITVEEEGGEEGLYRFRDPRFFNFFEITFPSSLATSLSLLHWVVRVKFLVSVLGTSDGRDVGVLVGTASAILEWSGDVVVVVIVCIDV